MEWQGYRDEKGYGRINGQGVHRMALALKLRRAVRINYFACHRCNNPPCINPDHLYEGTASDNLFDAYSMDGGKRAIRGSGSHFAKLTDERYEELRERALRGDETQATLAAAFGVTAKYVSKIKRGRGRASDS